MKLLKKVAESAVKPDKNNRNYKTITLETVPAATQNIPGIGNVAVHSPVKRTSKNVYESSYLNNQMEFGYDLPIGSFIAGDIVTRNVESYQIPDLRPGFEGHMRDVSTYSCAVFGDTTDEAAFNILAEREISRRHGVGTVVNAGLTD